MAEWSKALRSGRSPLLRAWVQIPLLTNFFVWFSNLDLILLLNITISKCLKSFYYQNNVIKTIVLCVVY